MTKFTAIADTSQCLLELLQKELIPDVLKSPNEIGMSSPGEKGEVSLALFLYDIQESEELHQRQMVNTHIYRQQYPPIFLNLYYMITAYSAGDLKYRMVQEERILGGVIQLFHDNPLIRTSRIQENGGLDLHLQLLKLSVDEKIRIWNCPGIPYKLSLFYRVSPIVIESGKERRITRVTEMDLTVRSVGNTE